MNGAKDSTNGGALAVGGSTLTGSRRKRIATAREQYAAGADTVRGVRPEILMSWYRCREEYDVDPGLDRAPAAAEVSAHSIEHDVVFAELGGEAASAGGAVDDVDGLATVADPDGRILAVWGSRRIQHLAAQSNLAPWSTWSEWACGTNGMGTALESHRPVMVRGPEHWCRSFQDWTCAGVAVRDVVTDDPLAVLNLSCWQHPLPDSVLPWLRRVAAATEAKLRQRAHHSGTILAAAFADARVSSAIPLAVVDPAGNVVLANSEAAVLTGTPADVPAYAPTQRWASQIPALPHLARRVTERARQDPDWTGSTQVFVPFLGTPIPVVARPVLMGTQVIGALLSFGSEADPGPALTGTGTGGPLTGPSPGRGLPSRVVALREDRWVLLDPREIRFAEADGNSVWLTSDQGRLLAAARGLDHLEQQLGNKGFLRVHRRFLVNLSRVREVEHGLKGTLYLATDPQAREVVPVARRHAPQLRQALGL
jgi:sigma-54 dependent transcriptional regulator, acetoin dehydrogenase operon transcriptional activator AcoR